jgi:hypothetical protein
VPALIPRRVANCPNKVRSIVWRPNDVDILSEYFTLGVPVCGQKRIVDKEDGVIQVSDAHTFSDAFYCVGKKTDLFFRSLTFRDVAINANRV